MVVDRWRSKFSRPSGNTGIAYAMIGAASGYRVKLCVPTNVPSERKHYGLCEDQLGDE